MYKRILFLDGNKSFLKTRGRIVPYNGSGSCGSYSGSGKVSSNMDNYLLSLIGGVKRMSIKPKKSGTKRRSGGALKFIR
jgi:hypothetical protein